jgi:serine/threonine protein kinase
VRELPVEAFSLIGKSVSHYRIIEKLGKGVMGEVFLAEDKNLDRCGSSRSRARDTLRSKNRIAEDRNA